MQREFHIPEQNLHGLKAKLEKLGRKAEKTGLPFPELRFGITFTDRTKDAKGQLLIVKYRKVILHWQSVMSSGWQVIGKLIHLPEGTLVRGFGSDEVPMQYRNAEPNCDHCKVKRKRFDTYVLRSLASEFKQCGSDCLQEYLKVDSGNVINAIKFLTSAIDTVQASEALPAIGKSPDMWPLEVFLAHVVDCINDIGWIPRSRAKAEGITATADIAYRRMIAIENYASPTQAGSDEALKAIEWAENVSTQGSEYIYNLHTIATSGAVEQRSLGYAASIVPTFRRELTGDKQGESDFVGKVGDRNDFLLTVDKIHDIDTAFGEQYVHIMRDDLANVFIWKTKDRLDEKKKYKLRGRIKEHKEYRDVKQTILTHCKIQR